MTSFPAFLLPVLAGVLGVAACSPSSGQMSPEPGTPDSQVAALVPTGSYLVEGVSRSQDSTKRLATISGYVNLGEAPDGADCVADYTVNIPSQGVLDVVRAKGGPAWYQAVVNDVEGGKLSPFLPDAPVGEWVDGADSARAPILPGLFFAPMLLMGNSQTGLQSNTGVEELCSLPLIPRFMSVADNRLVFDDTRVIETQRASIRQGVTAVVAAVGIDPAQKEAFISELVEIATPDLSFLQNVTLELKPRKGGGFVLVQRSTGETSAEKATVSMRLVFTPTVVQDVSAPEGVSSYFDQLAERARVEDPEQVLADVFGR